jgi:hypothetical protein
MAALLIGIDFAWQSARINSWLHSRSLRDGTVRSQCQEVDTVQRLKRHQLAPILLQRGVQNQ